MIMQSFAFNIFKIAYKIFFKLLIDINKITLLQELLK